MTDVQKGATGLLVAAIFILALSLKGCVGFVPNYSDGIREGELIKFSIKGFSNKSGEGQLQLSQFGLSTKSKASNNNNAGNLWEFSTTDPATYDAFNAAVGHKVRITYRQWFWTPTWRQDTEYNGIKVEIIDGK